MIIQADVKGLEVVVAAWLSQDPVLIHELTSGVDIHGENQKAFNLPERVIAKILKFRILYGGNEYSFINDPDFMVVSKKESYWKEVIEKYYTKYRGIAKWHNDIIREVSKTGMLITPLGRTFKWDLKKTGVFKLPITEIKNYPVQGTGADIVAIARVSLFRRMRAMGLKSLLINTVHDSIVFDAIDNEVATIVKLLKEVFRDLPSNIERIFNVKFDLEINVEILVGNDMYNLGEV